MYCAVYELAAVYCLRGGLRGSLWGVGRGRRPYAAQDIIYFAAHIPRRGVRRSRRVYTACHRRIYCVPVRVYFLRVMCVKAQAVT